MRMEVSVQSKQNVAVVATRGSLTVVPSQLQRGEILSQDMVSIALCVYVEK